MSFTELKQKYLLAPNPQTVRGQVVHLSTDPKNQQLLYTNGRVVYCRNIRNPNQCFEYNEHTCQATVAKFSPSGFYIASGDVQGNVRIWDTVNETHILKTQTRPLSGRINDICWDGESKRLLVVGDGKERYGHAFTFDAASSCGEIIGHSKVANSCSIRHQRPFRAVTGGDDTVVNFYHGVPYKFVKSLNDHQRFVQCVRYSPDGQYFVSVGSDSKIFLYDGASGDKVAEFTQGKHQGSIFSVSFSPDSKKFMTSSADKTVQLWDVAKQSSYQTITFDQSVDSQQVGGVWVDDSLLISLSLDGTLNYLDPNQAKPVQTVSSHSKSITALANDKETFYTGSYDGKLYQWHYDEKGVSGKKVEGSGHQNQVVGLTFAKEEGKLYSVGMDDVIKRVDLKSVSYDEFSLPTESIPKGIHHQKEWTAAVTAQHLIVLKNGEKKFQEELKSPASCVAISADLSKIIVGLESQKLIFYKFNQQTPTVESTVDLPSTAGAPTALDFHPTDQNLLGCATTGRQIILYQNTEAGPSEWCFHTARVNDIHWKPDGKCLASGGLDRDVYVWKKEVPTGEKNPKKFVVVKNVHQDGVTRLRFLTDSILVTTGQDASIKVWELK